MLTHSPVRQNQYSITRPRAPGWISCELCERPASRPHRRLRLTLVRHHRDDPPAATGERSSPRDAAGNPSMLVLLCSDCCAVVVGAIDDDEWRCRIGASLTPVNRPQLPSPSDSDPAKFDSR